MLLRICNWVLAYFEYTDIHGRLHQGLDYTDFDCITVVFKG